MYIDGEKYNISNVVRETTNQAMELTAVLACLQYLEKIHKNPKEIFIYCDSQYVCRLPVRRKRLEQKKFCNRRGEKLPNWQLVKVFFDYLDKYQIEFRKIAAHQPSGTSIESDRLRYVDKMARSLVRKTVKGEDV